MFPPGDLQNVMHNPINGYPIRYCHRKRLRRPTRRTFKAANDDWPTTPSTTRQAESDALKDSKAAFARLEKSTAVAPPVFCNLESRS